MLYRFAYPDVKDPRPMQLSTERGTRKGAASTLLTDLQDSTVTYDGNLTACDIGY